MLLKITNDRRISLFLGAILLAWTLLAGLAVHWAMRSESENTYGRSLQNDLEARVTLIENAIRQHAANTANLARQSQLQGRVMAALEHPDMSPDALLESLKELQEQGYSAIIAYDSAGRTLAQVGRRAESKLEVPLNLPQPTVLAWDDGYVVSTQVGMTRAGNKFASLLAEKRLLELKDSAADLWHLDYSASVDLCAVASDELQCFPAHQTISPSFSAALSEAAGAAMREALNGKSGFVKNHGAQGVAVAYMPVGTLGLGAMLSIRDTSGYLGLPSSEVRLLLPLLLFMVVIGAFLLRGQTLPLLRRAEAAEAQADQLSLQMRRQQERAQAVIAQISEGVVCIDTDGVIVTMNTAAEQMFGYSGEEWVGKNVKILMAGTDAEQHDTHIRRYLRSGERMVLGRAREVIGRRKNGEAFPMLLRLGEIQYEGTHLFIGSLSDLTDRKAAEARMAQLASYDDLTKLPNRNLLLDRARQALVHAARLDRRMGLLFLDLDQFKRVNDLLGHSVGDRLLQLVAERLLGSVGPEDTVARQGGDEFIILLPDLERFEEIALTAQKMLVALSGVYAIDDAEAYTSSSIGIAVYPEDGDDIETLMRHADTAMYYAKAMGRNNFQFFTRKMSQAFSERLGIESKLRQALARKEFHLVYQPIVQLDSGVSGAEALLRWHPEGGPIGPDRFIPVAEETGLILPIGEWVLRAAIEERARWLALGICEGRVAVNLSARQFDQKNLVAIVGRMLQEYGLPPELLGVEITESLLMVRADDAVRTLRGLSDLGVQIAIDDFGTGYSSLSYLKRFPLHKIKIDRSFVRDVASDKDDAAIVTAIIAMAHSLDASVVAEGVETAEQLHFLRERGCDEFQGYYFGRPVPSAVFLEKPQTALPVALG